MKQSSENMQIAILKSIDGKKVAEASDIEIKQELNCIYMIIGLRTGNYPNVVQERFIINWLREHYGYKFIKELSSAFNMAVKGELDLNDIRHFDNFTIMYFSQIMNSYHRKLRYLQAEAKPEKPNPKQLPAPVLTLADKKKEVDEFIQTNKLALSILPIYIYDYMDELNMIDHGGDNERMDRAKKLRLDVLFHEASQGGMQNRKDYAEFKRVIDAGGIPDEMINDLERLSKRIAIMDVIKSKK